MCLNILCSCGIRPIERPDNNISGVDVTQVEETDKPVSIPPETLIGFNTDPPESYPREWYPGMSNGTGGNGSVLSYLSDEKYIAEHTLGYFYIQNKRLGLYITQLTVIRGILEAHSYEVGDSFVIGNIKDANIFQLVELDDGYYTFLAPVRHIDDGGNDFRIAPIHQENAFYMQTLISYLWDQSYIIKKTDSGAYTIGSRYDDRYHYGDVWGLTMNTDVILKVPVWHVTVKAPYTPDADYSDEWLFIPAEPPETTAP